ncbi:unnamed protein product, partial [marine sediment metagenome]
MTDWLINHSWESFRRTKEYCGFVSKIERDKIEVEDKIVYFGQGMIFGVFEAIDLPNNEFKGWKKAYPFQVKLKPSAISENGIAAKPLESKILLQKSDGGSANLLELTETEFNRIKKAIEEGQ